MRPIMPRTTSDGAALIDPGRSGAGARLRQARLVRPQDLRLVEWTPRIRDLARQQPHVARAAGAVRAMTVAEGRHLKALPQERAEALDREHGRLVGGRLAADVDAHEYRAVVGQDAPDFVQPPPGIG